MLSLWLYPLLAVFCDVVTAQSTPTTACNSLAEAFPDQVNFPGNVVYEDVNEDFWSVSAALGPACIFTPIDANGTSTAVGIFKSQNVPFAIKGNGGMTIDGFANIDSSGILIATSNLTVLELSEDKSVVTIGAGNEWDAVYRFLRDYDLTTLGGRLGLVGVSGFLLGGGITFMSSEYGWASTLVVKYECVLAEGSVVEATADNAYSDLFWALKGGGNSFALVTKFYMETVPSAVVYGGYPSYGTTQRQQFVDTIYWYTITGDSDVKAGIEPQIMWTPGAEPSYRSAVMYDGDDANPSVLANFTGGLLVPAEETPLIRTTMYNYARAQYEGFDLTRTERARFSVISVRADVQAMDMVIDDLFPALDAELSGAANLSVSLVFMPFRENFLTASLRNGGNPMGYDVSDAPFIWLVQSFSWPNPEDDDAVDAFIASWVPQMEQRLAEKGLYDPFKFMLDAAQDQKVFENYGPENLSKLQAIRDKYDADMVFTKLMPGGWKVANAKI